MSVITPPTLESVQGAVLKDLTKEGGQERVIKSDELWSSQPVLLLVLRRPGCRILSAFAASRSNKNTCMHIVTGQYSA